MHDAVEAWYAVSVIAKAMMDEEKFGRPWLIAMVGSL